MISRSYSPDHAVTASTVYLIRSLGSVWGVAITSAILQTTLKKKLPGAIPDVPDKLEVSSLPFMMEKSIFSYRARTHVPDFQIIEKIRHSVTTLRELPVEIRYPARLVYYDGIRYAFVASTSIAALGIVAAMLLKGGRGMRSTQK